MSTTTTTAVSVDGLVVEYATGSEVVRALDCPRLDIAEASSVAVMGPSGCGKSTLLGVVAGLSSPTAGSVVIGGTDITALSGSDRVDFRRREVGMVYQTDNLLPFLTAAENVRLQLAVCGDLIDAAARVRHVLGRLGIGALGDRLPDALSGGQRQRVAVARAVVHEPALILADEPTGALDESNAALVVELLTDVQTEMGSTLVMVTHASTVAQHLERLVTLRDGVVVDDHGIA